METQNYKMGALPAGFSFDQFKVEPSGDKCKVVLPVLLTWTRQLAEPEVDLLPNGTETRKFILGIAIPKTSSKLLAAIGTASDEITAAAGVKGIYPKFLRDGAATNADGTFAKQNGKFSDFYYATAKTKNAPRIVRPGTSSAFEDVDPTQVYAGGFGVLSGTLLVLGYGSDTKKGTSLWFNSLLWLGGGEPMGGGGVSLESDFGAFVADRNAGAAAAGDEADQLL